MGRIESISEELIQKRDSFLSSIESDMHYVLNQKSNTLSFEWLDEIEKSCPFIDNIVRRPKVTLVREENVVEVERAKKITVDSVKDLSKHSNNITDVTDDDIKISKILDVRNEETYNMYENRFLYTLVHDLDRFIYAKEEELKNYDLSIDKVIDYNSESKTPDEKVNIELKVYTTKSGDDSTDLSSEIEKQKVRISRVKEYVTSWMRSDVVKELDKAHVTLINPPIKPTNVILKNPNFRVATKLWEYIRNYSSNIGSSKIGMESDGTKVLLSYLDDAFLTSYFVLDSISKKKKEEKQKICEYSVILLSELVFKTITLLRTNGYDMSTDELLSLLSTVIQKDEDKRLIGTEDIKKKFESEIEEFLEKTRKSL